MVQRNIARIRYAYMQESKPYFQYAHKLLQVNVFTPFYSPINLFLSISCVLIQHIVNKYERLSICCIKIESKHGRNEITLNPVGSVLPPRLLCPLLTSELWILRRSSHQPPEGSRHRRQDGKLGHHPGRSKRDSGTTCPSQGGK